MTCFIGTLIKSSLIFATHVVEFYFILILAAHTLFFYLVFPPFPFSFSLVLSSSLSLLLLCCCDIHSIVTAAFLFDICFFPLYTHIYIL